MRLLGHKMEAMITRLLGVILAALAAQFVIDGIERSFTIAWTRATSGTASSPAAAPAASQAGTLPALQLRVEAAAALPAR